MFSVWCCDCLGENKDEHKRQGDFFMSHKQYVFMCLLSSRTLGRGFLGFGILPLPRNATNFMCVAKIW